MTDDREALGRLVRETWVAYVRKHVKDPKPSHVETFDETDDFQREVDMLMASVVADVVTARVRGQFGRALRVHYLAGIRGDWSRHEDCPVCGCSAVFLGWYPSREAAIGAWADHVMETASESQERSGEKEAGNG